MHGYSSFILPLLLGFSFCQGPTTIRKLDFSSRKLTDVADNFSLFPELEEVDYSDNDIETVRVDAFATNTKLKRIDFSGNRQLNFPDQGPFLQTGATFLNLSNCYVEYVPGNALDGMPNLEVLDLRGNPIVFEDSLAFEVTTTPPKKIIVSRITEADLAYVCHRVDMLVVIIEEHKEVTCKEVRELTPFQKSKSVKNEKLKKEGDFDVNIDMIEDGLIDEDTHLEVMMSDEPLEGSGEEEIEAKSGEITVDESISSEAPENSTGPDENLSNISNVDETPTGAAQNITNTDDTSIGVDENKIDSDETPVFADENAPKIAQDDKTTSDVVSGDSNTNESQDGVDENKIDSDETPSIAEQNTPKIAQDDETTSDVVSSDSNADESPIGVDQNDTNSDEAPIGIDESEAKNDDGEQNATEGYVVPEGRKIAVPELDQSNSRFRKIVPDKIRNDAETVDMARKTNEEATSEDILDKPAVAQDTATPSSSSTVILFLILGVVVVGSALVGYRYWKDKKTARYDPVNGGLPKENPTEGKELKEIAMEKSQGRTKESSPLMQRLGDGVEFKEVNEVVPKPPRSKNDEAKANDENVYQEVVTAKKTAARDMIGDSKNELPHIDDDLVTSRQNINVNEHSDTCDV